MTPSLAAPHLAPIGWLGLQFNNTPYATPGRIVDELVHRSYRYGYIVAA